MAEKDVLKNLTFVGGAAAFYREVLALMFGLRWAFVLIVLLIVLDFGYGIADSVGRRGEEFHLSRAGRRTVCKFIEYLTYPIVGGVLGLAILEPMGWGEMMTGGAAGAALAVLFEADSISEHFCSVHGLKRRFSVKGWIIRKLTEKLGGGKK